MATPVAPGVIDASDNIGVIRDREPAAIPPTTLSPLARMRHVAVAAIVLGGTFVAYQQTVVRFLNPAAVAAVPMSQVRVDMAKPAVGDLFPPGAWQTESCLGIRTADAMVLFQQYESTGEDEWRLWPITLVYGRGIESDPDAVPVIMESMQGAKISFDGVHSLFSGGGQPFRRGVMEGEVTIRRHSPEHSLEVRARDVVFDPRQIRTSQSVDVAFGEARMIGRDLTLYLSAALRGNRSEIQPDRMEMIYLQRCELPLSMMDRRRGSNPTTSSQTGGQVSLACRGRVRYDFAADRLTLEDQIEIRHQPAAGTIRQTEVRVDGRTNLIRDELIRDELVRDDIIRADTISIRLNAPMASGRDRATFADWIMDVHATGNPLVADLPTLQSRIQTDSLDWNVTAGELAATSADPRGTRLTRGVVTTSIGSLDYRYDPRTPEQFGRMTVPGDGHIAIDDPGAPIAALDWTHGLTITPETDSPASQTRTSPPSEPPPLVVQTGGGLSAQVRGGGTVTADAITARLVPQITAPASTATSNTTDRSTKRRKPDVRYVADVVRAGSVVADTPRFEAVADVMRLFFVDRPTNQSGPNAPAARTDAATDADRVIQPLVTAEGPPASTSSGEPPPSRYVIRGGEVNAEIFRDNLTGTNAPARGDRRQNRGPQNRGRNHIADNVRQLSINGGVDLSTDATIRDQTMPLKFAGQTLQYSGATVGDLIRVTGAADRPARIDIGEGYFVGGEIQIRPRHDHVAIPGPGELALPPALMPQGGLTWTKPPTLRFAESLIAGGVQVRAEGDIRIDGRAEGEDGPLEFRVAGDALVADLTRPISFAAAQTRSGDASPPPELKLVTLTPKRGENVIADAFTRDANQGGRLSRHRFDAPKIRLQPVQTARASGKRKPGDPPPMVLTVDGPGDYRGWFRNRPSEKPEASPIEAVHLAFRRWMVADVQSQDVRIGPGVRIASRGVDDWETTITAEPSMRLPDGGQMMLCDSLQIIRSANSTDTPRDPRLSDRRPPPPLEIRASGAVRFASQSEDGRIEGEAETATYDTVTDWLSVRGVPARPVSIVQTTDQGQRSALCESVIMHPRTMTIETIQMRQVQLGIPAERLPGGGSNATSVTGSVIGNRSMIDGGRLDRLGGSGRSGNPAGEDLNQTPGGLRLR